MAARAGIGFTALDNGFAACDDVAAVQQICDSFDEHVIEALAARWLDILPCPYSPADHAAGYRYEISVRAGRVLPHPGPRHSRWPGVIFSKQAIRDNLDIGRPDQVGLIFGRRIMRTGPRATPGRFRTRVITDGRIPVPARRLQAFPKIKQYHKEGKALQNGNHDQRHPRLRHRQTADLTCPPCGQIGFHANRRLLAVERLSHDPAAGQAALRHLSQPLTTSAGTRIAGLRLGDPRAHALLAALCMFRLLPRGFANSDLRPIMARLLGLPAESITPGKMTYDLRRLRQRGFIARIPHTFRYQVTDAGLAQAVFLTRLHDRFLRTGLASLAGPGTGTGTITSTRGLAAATRAYTAAIDDLARHAGLAA